MTYLSKLAALANKFITKLADYDYDKRSIEDLVKIPDATLRTYLQMEQLSLPKYNEVIQFRKEHPALTGNPIPEEVLPTQRVMQDSKSSQ